MAGNHLMTELTIATGAIEAVGVDYQWIMPRMVQAAAWYHTEFLTAADRAQSTGATPIPFNTATAAKQARGIVDKT